MTRRPLALAGLGLAGLAVAVAARATPDPAVVATDRAHEALAAGEPARAAQLLGAALAGVPPEAADRLRCLQGEALLDAGEPARAAEALAAVRPEAPCARRAGWGRVEALGRLGRADEAAALAEALGGPLAGEDRDGATAQALAGLARRLGDDPDRGGQTAQQLLEVALGLEISDARTAELADQLSAAFDGAWSPPLCDAQVRALAAFDAPDRRLRAALACGPLGGLALAEPLPEAQRFWALGAQVPADPAAVDVFWSAALEGPDAGPWMREALARWRTPFGDLGAAEDAFGLGPEEAAGVVAMLALAGRDLDAADRADVWLASWPTHPARSEVEARRAAALLAHARARRRAGDPAAALSALRPLADDAALGDVALAEAGFAALALGDATAARDAWERARARFPQTEGAATATRALARHLLADGGLETAEAFLRTARDGDRNFAAAVELERLRGEDVWIAARSVDRGDPVVRVGARNLAEVELRLHAVDPEAWFRAGGDVAGLAELDVAAIAPDRRWTVPISAPPGRDTVVEVPVKVPRPGLYAVTAAAPAEEARALVLVSELRLATRTVAGDTAVAVLDAAGRPVGGARVLLVDGEVVEGRTGPDGLFVDRSGGAPSPVVAVEKGGSWAFAPRPAPQAARTRGLELAVELDRPAYLPEDRVGMRIVGHRDGAPLPGRWTVWLEGGAARAVEADARGVLALDLPIPPATAWSGRGDALDLFAVPPGETVAQPLASVRVAPPDPLARTLRAEMDGSSAVAAVEGPDGEPLAGARVTCAGELGGRDLPCGEAVTDALGRARFAGPRADLPWRATLTLEDGPSDRADRDLAPADPVRLRVVEDHLRPGEALQLAVEGGAAVVSVVRRVSADPAGPPPDPWVEAPEAGLRGPGRVDDAGSLPRRDPTHEEPVARFEVGPGAGWVEVTGLPALPAGDYVVRAVRADGRRAVSASAPLRVDGGLRFTGARDVGLGESLTLVPSGPALLTAEADGLLWAAVRPAGAAAEVAVDARWRGEVTVAATGADGTVHARRVQADPDPVVTLAATPTADGARFVVRAEVRDHAGRPIDAEVSFTAWDERLEDALSGAHPPALAPFGRLGEPTVSVGFQDHLADGDAGEPIAGALLAEAALRREREKARSALESGLLSDNALAEAMLRDLPADAVGYGGIGARGTGMGGGGSASGYGRGGGTFGGRTGHGLPGHRDRALWQVVAARGGRAEVEVPLPPARWRLRATALTAAGVGTAFAEADATRRVWAVAPSPGPGAPGDEASPVVLVVNGTGAPARARIAFGSDVREPTLEPGAHAIVGPRVPAGGALALAMDGVALPWAFPLAEGEPDAAGPVTLRAASRADVAFRGGPQPGWGVAEWAHFGRAALLLGDRDRAWAARDALAGARPNAPLDASALAAFLAEGRAVFGVGDAELDGALDAVTLAGSAEERAAAALALRAGGRPVDPERDAAPPPVDPTGPPPLPGEAALVDWLRARPEGPVSWPATGLPVGELPPRLLRVPAGPGRPRPVAWAEGLEDAACDPCSVAVGDALWDAAGGAEGALPAVAEGRLRLARWPGIFTLAGRHRAVHVTVGDAPTTPVPRPWSRPTVPLPEDDGALARAAAEAGFAAALRAGDDAGLAEAWRTLLRTAPDAPLALADRARAARALRAVGRPEEAVAAWRAVADEAFVAEVKGLERARPIAGDLVVVQKTREAALRYPEVPAVGGALAVLPGQLLALAASLPPEVAAAGIDATDVRLTAAAWDREFLATSPDHPRAAAAGLRLGRTFLALHAPDEALRWATRVADTHPDDPLRDGLLFLRAVAATEAGEADRAEPWLRALATEVFPGPDGQPRRSEHAGDAKMALGRLLEARGRLGDAVATYREAGGAEADAAVRVLTARSLSAPPLVTLGPSGRAELPLEVRGVDALDVRAWRVDVRTLFLRDGGLGGVAGVAVDGLAPAWSGRRPVKAGPYPRSVPLELPLAGTGAWLVQLDAEGVHAATLVVRSALVLTVSPDGRVDLRRGDGPAAGAEVRALVGGGVEPAVTDVRGVAQVTPGAPVLAWLGEDVAFTPPAEPGARLPAAPRAPAASPVEVLDRRLREEAARDEADWQEFLR